MDLIDLKNEFLVSNWTGSPEFLCLYKATSFRGMGEFLYLFTCFFSFFVSIYNILSNLNKNGRRNSAT
jgi:hypothetical protein